MNEEIGDKFGSEFMGILRASLCLLQGTPYRVRAYECKRNTHKHTHHHGHTPT
jgi:hypothetical protein